MLKYTTLREDVKDITNQILAIQAADEAQQAMEDGEESVDTPRKGRGIDSRYDYSLKQLAEIMGLSDAPHPEKRAGTLYDRAIRNYTKNQYLMLNIQIAEKLGLTPDEADEYVSLLYALELENGRDIVESIRGIING